MKRLLQTAIIVLLFFSIITRMEAQQTQGALSPKERQIAAISMYTSLGQQDSLKAALARGFDAGLTLNEGKEVLLQLYAYCGFPRSMNALTSLMEVAKSRAAQGIVDAEGPSPSPVEVNDRMAYGDSIRYKLFGRKAQGEILSYFPALDDFLKANLFGDLFGRDNLDWKTRELVTVSAVSVQDSLENELRIHIAHGKHNGLTDAQVAEVLTMSARCRNGMVLTESEEPRKTFAVDPTIKVEKVFYKTRYDITLCAEIYYPANMDTTRQYAALIVGHPFGAVKEQCSGLYAQEMARRGFVALAFDASYQGESGGLPRHTVSPDALVEDFSASVDFLGTLPYIDRNRIGVIGICGSGGFAVCAASLDPRIKALATVSMYDMGRATRSGLGDSMTDALRRALLDQVAQQRWAEADGETPRIRFGTPEQLPENPSPVQEEFFNYYRNIERGYHPRYQGTRYTSQAALMNFYPFAMIKEISPRPVLFIAGENAHSRYFSEDAYAEAGEPKELYLVKGANHVDLYDQTDKIPFDKITDFFKSNLQ
ncbi:MAG: carboxymuconolactone decarboxylase family protein [Bacteroidales bacterium]|nr:carboxymuconolactone decarboxylase family protein [Bacteroidales bacterium]